MSCKAFVFGIDGGDWEVVEPLMASGRLPHLAAFHQRAAHGPMTCTQPAHTAPGWASLVSASYPGKHGIFQFFDTQEPSYRARVTSSFDLGMSDMFAWFNDQGWRVGAVNVPMSHPPRPLQGFQITWPLANTLRFSHPPGLLGELARAGAPFRSDLACMYRGHLDYIHEAVANIEQRVRSVETLMATQPVDFLMVVLTEVDRVCHHYWHFADPRHPEHSAAAKAEHREAIVLCYEAVDRAFGRLQALMGPDTVTVVVSDHGSGLGLWDLSVNRVLEEAGLLVTKPRESRPAEGANTVASWHVGETREIDWEKTRAYVPVPGSFGVNLNLRGRQAKGCVDKGEGERVLEDVATLLKETSLPSPLVGGLRVLRAEEAYPGPHQHRAPDLLIVPDDERMILSAHVEGTTWRPSYQTGLHRHRGMWMQSSPRTVAGRLQAPIRIVDVAPTLCADVGLGWPALVDGQPHSQAFRKDAASPAALEVEGAGDWTGTMDEDPFVTERLRAMGYL
jgi:predicted AlkP superfamily phosphohydrolase/phosphomutase